MRRTVFLVAFLTLSSPANASSLKDFWSSRPSDDPHFQSTKSSLALEECIALEVSENVGIPNVIHGEGETIITGMGTSLLQQPIGGARIIDHGASREIVVGAIHSGGWRNKVSALVQRCI